MTRALAAFTLVLLLVPAVAAAQSPPDPWLTSFDEAVAAAKPEGRLIVMQLRVACGSCNAAVERLVADGEQHEGIRRSFHELVRLRADAPEPAAGAAATETSVPSTVAATPFDALLRSMEGVEPGLYLLDPTGRLILRLDATRVETLANALAALRAHAAALTAASAKRAQGNDYEADTEIGLILLEARQTHGALLLLDRATERATQQQNQPNAQLAQLLVARAWAQGDQFPKAYQIARGVAADPATPVVQSMAYLVMAAVDEALRHRSGAIDSYRKAYEAAPPGSEMEGSARDHLLRLGTTVLPAKASAPNVFQLVMPPGDALVGSADVGITPGPGTTRVDLFVDEHQVASVTAGKRVRVELGPGVRPHPLRAVAFDAAGAVRGEARAVINRGAQTFTVRLTRPTALALTGKVDLAAETTAPPPHNVRRVDFYWNETLVGSAASVPYVATHTLAGSEAGYFRAVAELDDGRSAEDVHLVNAGGFVAESKVQQVELYASIADRQGRPVAGLTRANVDVRDEGKGVAPVVRDVSQEPMTVGIAIDTSGSMTRRILQLQEGGSQFLRETLKGDDRAFLVAFDSRPRLLHPISSDVKGLTDRLFDLYMGGDTSIYDALVFSLQRYLGVEGRKALIVFTDGAETQSADSVAAATKLARQSGVPVFVLLFRERPPVERQRIEPRMRRPGEAVFNDRPDDSNHLSELAEATGGELVYATSASAVADLFASVRNRLQSEYLLTYPAPAAKKGTWRKVTVTLRGTDGKVQAPTGYYAE